MFWQDHFKRGTLPQDAFNTYFAVMRVRDPLCDRQT
jgi:hypothetical protein